MRPSALSPGPHPGRGASAGTRTTVRCRPARHRTTVSHVNAPDPAVGAGHAADGRVRRDPPDQARLRQLADEQVALRRVATLVAQATPPEAVFAAVAEVGQLF